MPDPLRVALDATPLTGPVGGIRRFTAQLLEALREEFPNDHYIPLSDQIQPSPRGLERRWWLYGLSKAITRAEANLFHGTDFAVPYLPATPSIMTVHDLSPWHDPTPASARVRSRARMLLRLRIPTFIHTPSETVREEVIDRFRWPKDRVLAIPLAAAPLFMPAPSPAPPYFLYLGTLEPRKNLEVLRYAMDQLWQRGFRIPLRLAGRTREGYRVPAHQSIEYLGPQEESALPALLSNATAVVYPSRYEGFGLPILEALQCGAPVIASDIPVHREVGGDAALYASPADPNHWADQLTRVLKSPPPPATLIAHARRFSWKQTAHAFHDLYLRCRKP